MKNNAKIIERRNIIHLYYSHQGKPLYISTGIKANEKKKYEVQIRNQFNNFESIILKYYQENNEYPSVSELKKRLQITKASKDTLFSLAETFIKTKEIRKTTLNTQLKLANIFQEFEQNHPVNINKLDSEFVSEFQNFLFNLERKHYFITHIDGMPVKSKNMKGMCDNNTRNLIKLLKSTINYHIENNTIKKHKIDWEAVYKKCPYEKYPEETFTKEELDFLVTKRHYFANYHKVHDTCPECGSENIKLYTYNTCKDCGKRFIPQTGIRKKELYYRYDKCLDLMLFQCYTSLRWSDAIRPLKGLIQDDIIHLKAIKTKNNQDIPLNTLTKQLLTENNYNFEMNRAAFYNTAIKSILKHFSNEMPSFAELRVERRNVNCEEYSEMVPRYMRFSSHSCRRTAITLMINAGVPDGEVMKITGHSSWECYKGYYDTRPIGGTENIMEKLFKGEKY